MVLVKIAAHWLLSCYREARKNRSYGFLYRNSTRSSLQASLYPSVSKCSLEGRESQTLVCDIHGTLLRSPSFYPFFMLVAFEGGSIIRALLLLCSYPLLWLLNHDEVSLRVLVFITFCGLRKKDMETVARAVLPKFYLENLNLHAYEVLASTGKKVVVTSVPRVMVEGFLKEYLSVDQVLGTELQMVWGNYYFTGLLLPDSGMALRHNSVKDFFGDQNPDLGLGSCFNPYDHLFLSLCKEAYVVNKEGEGKSGDGAVMPRKRYPKPLIFHDGRLAFFPTPMATLALFIWLPFGICVAVYRLLLGLFIPYRFAIIFAAFTGVVFRVDNRCAAAAAAADSDNNNTKHRGVLYVCTHRTLADPVVLCTALAKSLTAVTYSLSKMTELMAPIRTVRLTRDRVQDRDTMHRLLQEGDLAVCPEGTTCREPYLLRFSPLFAELTDQIVPVAMDVTVDMFYGTTASGLKWLDPFFCLMNPRPAYRVVVLGKVPREFTCAGGLSSYDVANRIQKLLGEALGFECTSLTRKDKYLMLAGNEGVVVNGINGCVKKDKYLC